MILSTIDTKKDMHFTIHEDDYMDAILVREHISKSDDVVLVYSVLGNKCARSILFEIADIISSLEIGDKIILPIKDVVLYRNYMEAKNINKV